MRNKAIKQNGEQPYLFRHYNVHEFYTSNSNISNKIGRLMQSFVDALNAHHLLPKLILIIPDVDLLEGLQDKSGVSIILGKMLHHIIKQMDLLIERCKRDLLEKCLGSTIGDQFPKLIWVRTLKRPQSMGNALFNLRGKFNSILEERLMDGNASNHYIISIEVDTQEFHITGDLTDHGKEQFWKEINKGISRFEANAITLKPRQFAIAKKKDNIRILPVLKAGHLKLPTPPPKRKHDSSKNTSRARRSSSRKRSRSRSHRRSRSSRDRELHHKRSRPRHRNKESRSRSRSRS